MRAARDERMVRLGNRRVRVQVLGDGAGSPLLLLNGLGAPLELWDPLLKALRVGTIAFDAPGSGGSDAPLLPMSIEGHARLALDLLDDLGIARADVLGLSFGGMVAQELARLAPTRIERLILASTTVGWGSVPGSPAALLAITTPDRYYSRAVFEATAPKYIGGRESANAAFLRHQSRARVRHPPNRQGYLYQCLAASLWSSLCWLSEVTQPTLVLAGERDPLVPPVNAEILARLIPNARKHIVAGGGHLCLLERARVLAPLIDGFLSRQAVDVRSGPGLPDGSSGQSRRVS